MAISRFIRDGLADVDRRLAVSRLREPDDEVALRIIEGSRIYALVTGALSWCDGVARGSTAMSGARRAAASWRRRDVQTQQLVIGGTLVCASSAHLFLSQWLNGSSGWLWLVVPVLALLAGVLLMLPAGLRRKGEPL